MSRISELEFYNDKDVITQIEWLKNNIQADHIDHIQVEQNTEKDSEEYGLTTVKITMENGHEYKGEVLSAILKDVRIQSGEDFNVMVFELANGETISTNIPLGSDSYWAKIKGEPQSNTALKAWMDEKAEAVDLTNETNLRVRSDEALGQRITDLDRDVSEEIERIDGELANKADKSALDEEITKRTEADTGLLQAITQEETARTSADAALSELITQEETARTNADTALGERITQEETVRQTTDEELRTDITKKAEQSALVKEIADRTKADILKEDKSNKVSSWSATPSNDKYPSEKLVSDWLMKSQPVPVTFVSIPGVSLSVNKIFRVGKVLFAFIQGSCSNAVYAGFIGNMPNVVHGLTMLNQYEGVDVNSARITSDDENVILITTSACSFRFYGCMGLISNDE